MSHNTSVMLVATGIFIMTFPITKRIYFAIMRGRFKAKYGFKPAVKQPRVMRIHYTIPTRRNTFELVYPRWRKSKKGGTADNRYGYNPVDRFDSTIRVGNFVLRCKDPITTYNVVMGLRKRGVEFVPNAIEQKKTTMVRNSQLTNNADERDREINEQFVLGQPNSHKLIEAWAAHVYPDAEIKFVGQKPKHGIDAVLTTTSASGPLTVYVRGFNIMRGVSVTHRQIQTMAGSFLAEYGPIKSEPDKKFVVVATAMFGGDTAKYMKDLGIEVFDARDVSFNLVTMPHVVDDRTREFDGPKYMSVVDLARKYPADSSTYHERDSDYNFIVGGDTWRGERNMGKDYSEEGMNRRDEHKIKRSRLNSLLYSEVQLQKFIGVRAHATRRVLTGVVEMEGTLDLVSANRKKYLVIRCDDGAVRELGQMDTGGFKARMHNIEELDIDHDEWRKGLQRDEEAIERAHFNNSEHAAKLREELKRHSLNQKKR